MLEQSHTEKLRVAQLQSKLRVAWDSCALHSCVKSVAGIFAREWAGWTSERLSGVSGSVQCMLFVTTQLFSQCLMAGMACRRSGHWHTFQMSSWVTRQCWLCLFQHCNDPCTSKRYDCGATFVTQGPLPSGCMFSLLVVASVQIGPLLICHRSLWKLLPQLVQYPGHHTRSSDASTSGEETEPCSAFLSSPLRDFGDSDYIQLLWICYQTCRGNDEPMEVNLWHLGLELF